MGMVGDLCKKLTDLAMEDIAYLERMGALLPVAADLAHAQLTLYVRAAERQVVVVVAQARPHTTFVRYKPHLLGTVVPCLEEPLVEYSLKYGQSILGQREWALGMLGQMQTLPVCNAQGEVIAVLSCESSMEEAGAAGHELLLETAQWLLLAAVPAVPAACFKTLTASDGIILVDPKGQILFANAAAAHMYRVLGAAQLPGRHIYERGLELQFVEKAHAAQQPAEAECEAGGMVLVMRALPILHKGKVQRLVVLVSDVTELRKKEKELLIKSAVIQEIHHRVKNNLQTIASLLRLQARRSTSPEVQAALRESVNRILSISVVHEFLSQQDAEIIDVAEVARNILETVSQNMLEPEFDLNTELDGNTVILPSEQASSLALVINELIQNSLEHAFVGRKKGTIGIIISSTEDMYEVVIYDDGVGLPETFAIQDLQSLGLQISRTLVESDLGGRFSLEGCQGTRARITIPKSIEGGR
mgnify:FL=1